MALRVEWVWSGDRLTELFQEPPPKVTWLVTLADFTPGIARSIARSLRVSADAFSSVPMPVSWMRTSSFSAWPVGRCMRSSRPEMRNRALQMIAQLSAISSTISADAVLCRRSVDRIGRISMVCLRKGAVTGS